VSDHPEDVEYVETEEGPPACFRDRLIFWVMNSRLLCLFGAHMWLTSMAFLDEEFRQIGTSCGACGKLK
jgi:hypothetical protein